MTPATPATDRSEEVPESSKSTTDSLVEFARAVNAIDWQSVLRAAVTEYNRQMSEVNGTKPQS